MVLKTPPHLRHVTTLPCETFGAFFTAVADGLVFLHHTFGWDQNLSIW